MLVAIKCPMDCILVVYRVSDSGEKKSFFWVSCWNNVTLWLTFRTQNLGPDQLALFSYNRSLFNKYWILIWLRTWLLESEQNQSAFIARIVTASILFPRKICSHSAQGLPRTETSCCDKALSGLALPQQLEFCSSFQSLKYFKIPSRKNHSFASDAWLLRKTVATMFSFQWRKKFGKEEKHNSLML